MLAFEPSVSQHRDAEIKVSHTWSQNVICSYILMTAVAVCNRGQWCNERQQQTRAAALEGIFCSHPCPPPPSTEAKSQSRVKQLCLWDAGACLRLGPCLCEKEQVHAGTLLFCLSTSHLCQPRREFEANDGQEALRSVHQNEKKKPNVTSGVLLLGMLGKALVSTAETGLLREGHSLWGSYNVWESYCLQWPSK